MSEISLAWSRAYSICPRPTTRIKPATGLDSEPEGLKKRYKILSDRILGRSRAFQCVQPPTACALLRAARLLPASAAALPLLGPPAPARSAAVGAGGTGLMSRQAGSVRRARGLQLLLSSPSSAACCTYMCWSRRPFPLFFLLQQQRAGVHAIFTLFSRRLHWQVKNRSSRKTRSVLKS